ncbi:MAG TPA: VWA domain-containing protein [Terriglobales bacterium]|nr:VWA domain-containing protein [Terriglobales bacterium]
MTTLFYLSTSKVRGTVLMGNQVRRLFLPVFLFTAICSRTLLFGQSAASRSEKASALTYHSDVSEVRLVFFATDEHHHAVQDLQKTDFAVVDDERVIRDFRSFTRPAAIKLDVIVLFDSSDSVLPHFKQEITEVLHLVSQWPWGPEDNVSVLSFSGTEAHPVCAGDCRNSFTAARVASLPTGGSTPLFDALDTAASLLSKRRQPDVWPVIALFSDGDDTISKASFKRAIEKTLTSEAQVYTIDVGNPGQPSNGAAMLQEIADESGGRYVRIREGAARIFTDVIDDLHSARVVTYGLPESGSDFHSIRILPTHNLNWQFRCRRGYYYRSDIAH